MHPEPNDKTTVHIKGELPTGAYRLVYKNTPAPVPVVKLTEAGAAVTVYTCFNSNDAGK